MIVLLQRVSSGQLITDGVSKKSIVSIGRGLVALVGFGPDDERVTVDRVLTKSLGLRIFADNQGRMNLSLNDIEGELLVMSQFTLYANCRRGNRPSFIGAAPRSLAISLYQYFLEQAGKLLGTRLQYGKFGSDLTVEILNDGPVTLWLDSKSL